MKVAIISHTEHYRQNNQIVGWGATVREINHLATAFDAVYHLAVLHEGEAPSSSLPYTAKNIHFIPLKPSGGTSLRAKWHVIAQAPATIRSVREVLSKVDVFQFRAPTGMGVYLIPWLIFFSKKPGWFKYAGNWMQPQAPWGYRIQKFWLSKFNNRPVTINGRWSGQPAHCLSFENPCLDEADMAQGKMAIAQKDFSDKLDFCFVGRLEDAKGVAKILDALAAVKSDKIGSIHLVGDGIQRKRYEAMAASLPYPVTFYGFLSREEVNKIYARSHIFLLPSDSEGFPKVLAEAMNFGCVPLVSDVSSIPQYIQDGKNGFLWRSQAISFPLYFSNWIHGLDKFDLRTIADQASQIAETFTYQHYIKRLCDEVLN